MIGILIVAHAPIASALHEGAKHVFKELPHIEAHDVSPHNAIVDELAALHSKLQTCQTPSGTLLLNDICGATPYNLCLELIAAEPNRSIQLISGVNLPMLLRAITYRHLTLTEVVDKAYNGAKDCIFCMPDSPH